MMTKEMKEYFVTNAHLLIDNIIPKRISIEREGHICVVIQLDIGHIIRWVTINEIVQAGYTEQRWVQWLEES